MTAAQPQLDIPTVVYRPPPTGVRLMEDDSFFRGIVGPIGSGKSVLCGMTLMEMSQAMPPDLQGRRRSRNAIVRNTYRELQDTTMQTLFDWFPQHDPDLGFEWSESDMTWTVRDDASGFETQWLFRALDRPDHVRKLLSLELTFAWLNEAREIPKSIVDMLIGRLGRYPSMRDYGWETDPEYVFELLVKMQDGYEPVVGVDIPYWYGLLGDTNPCDEDHWWYRAFEEDMPVGWRVFHQPPADEGHGENLANLHPLYYHRLRQGKSEAWVKVYVKGHYGFVQDGKPVYPEYNDALHCPDVPLPVDHRKPVVLGGDGGLTPACVFLQKRADGGWDAVDEVVCERLGAVNYAAEVKRNLDTVFRGCPVYQGWFDPAGADGSSLIDENETVIEVLQDAGLPFDPSPDKSNGETRRREAVASALTTLTPAGLPRLRVSKKCRYLRKGLAGGFQYRRLQVAGEERYHDKRDKTIYSHICEALEYAMVGEGEGYDLVPRGDNAVTPGLPSVRGLNPNVSPVTAARIAHARRNVRRSVRRT